MTQSMKDAIMGQGAHLQGASSALGNMMTEQTQSGGQKKATDANTSLNELSQGDKRSGATVPGTSVKAADQVANQQTGTADHLDLGFRK